jgi:hypothetical protein
METNNIDKKIKEKLQNRTFQPSASAWERLSSQLDEEPKQKKRGWFFYVGAAASILLLVSIGILMFSKDSKEIVPVNEIVIAPIDTIEIDEKIDKLINEIPSKKVLVKVDEIMDKQVVEKNVISVKEKFHPKKKRIVIAKNEVKKEESLRIAQVNKKEIHIDKKASIKSTSEIKKEALHPNPNRRIKINSDDLLYAVTHSSREVKSYYAKYNVNRDNVLNTIKIELKKSNLKVDPNTILAEVERTIDDDDFQNNFMKSLKKKVSNFATAIASRNN